MEGLNSYTKLLLTNIFNAVKSRSSQSQRLFNNINIASVEKISDFLEALQPRVVSMDPEQFHRFYSNVGPSKFVSPVLRVDVTPEEIEALTEWMMAQSQEST